VKGYAGALLVLALSAEACHSDERTKTTTSIRRPEDSSSALSQELGVPIPADATILGFNLESARDAPDQVGEQGAP